MARLNNPKGKIVRRFGDNIFEQPKYSKLLDRKPNKPGKAPKTRDRRKISDYGLQLEAKQKLRFTYGLSEKQFYNLYEKAKKRPGDTGMNMLKMLEQRIDNTVFRLNWASSRAQARQMVSHGHILVNGKRLNIPSAQISPGDEITLTSKKGVRDLARQNLGSISRRTTAWLNTDNDEFKADVAASPEGLSENIKANQRLIIEYYSR